MCFEFSIFLCLCCCETIATQLQVLSIPVTEMMMTTKQIWTLPPSYRNFILALDNLDDAGKTIHSLTSRLLKEESVNKNSVYRWQ